MIIDGKITKVHHISDSQATINLPKTTTMKCVRCVDSGEENMCAVSNKDPSSFDVCGGDSGGSLKNYLLKLSTINVIDLCCHIYIYIYIIYIYMGDVDGAQHVTLVLYLPIL